MSAEQLSRSEFVWWLSTPPTGFVLIQWPESQEYIGNPNCMLDMSGQYGDVAYWIPEI